MNFSEPGSATTTTINSSTPMHLARALFSGSAYPIKISDFTRQLSAIHDAAYLMLLPKTSNAEQEFHQSEAARISNGPLGAEVLQATTLFLLNTCRNDAVDAAEITPPEHADIYEATGCMLRDLAAEQERYLSNMTLLLSDMKKKWTTDLLETGRFVLFSAFSFPFFSFLFFYFVFFSFLSFLFFSSRSPFSPLAFGPQNFFLCKGNLATC